MGTVVDARGFSCPQPVIMTMNKMKELGSGQIEILVDTDTSKENVSRAAASKGWRVVEIRSEGSDYGLTITK
jgi:tRNA 2-thiouridine synthesizing protein A